MSPWRQSGRNRAIALHAAKTAGKLRSTRRSVPILPFAEIYTVIDLVSNDSRDGWREGPVHLEGHRLVHDRLVGRVLREFSASEVPNIERLLTAGVKVVHCLVQKRPDGLGTNHNAKIFAIGSGVDIIPGGPGASLLPELGPAPTDVVLSRSHGIGPMGGTDLDATLHNLGVSTIVAVGVSVNVAIANLVMDAVNRAYRVVVPRDAVAGIPTDYATSIIDNTLSLLATITTTDDLIEVWKQS